MVNNSTLTAGALKILIADDNDVSRSVFHTVLSNYGHDVHAVEDGLKAFEAIESQPYDLVFMDGQMPVLDGYEATKKIRRHSDPRVAKTVIIAFSGNSLPEDAVNFFAAGMNDVLLKPARTADIRQIIAKWTTPKKNLADS